MLKPGDVVLTKMQFVDTNEIKTRPALVLFQQYGNVVVAGITSNQKMQGILLSRKEGAIKDSVIKLNYLFTITQEMVPKVLFHLSKEKKQIVFEEFVKLLDQLKKTTE